jgi:hypothetical protein
MSEALVNRIQPRPVSSIMHVRNHVKELPSLISPQDLHKVRQDITKVILPSEFAKISSEFGDISCGKLKADEWRSLLAVYLPLTVTKLSESDWSLIVVPDSIPKIMSETFNRQILLKEPLNSGVTTVSLPQWSSPSKSSRETSPRVTLENGRKGASPYLGCGGSERAKPPPLARSPLPLPFPPSIFLAQLAKSRLVYLLTQLVSSPSRYFPDHLKKSIPWHTRLNRSTHLPSARKRPLRCP